MNKEGLKLNKYILLALIILIPCLVQAQGEGVPDGWNADDVMLAVYDSARDAASISLPRNMNDVLRSTYRRETDSTGALRIVIGNDTIISFSDTLRINRDTWIDSAGSIFVFQDSSNDTTAFNGLVLMDTLGVLGDTANGENDTLWFAGEWLYTNGNLGVDTLTANNIVADTVTANIVAGIVISAGSSYAVISVSETLNVQGKGVFLNNFVASSLTPDTSIWVEEDTLMLRFGDRFRMWTEPNANNPSAMDFVFRDEANFDKLIHRPNIDSLIFESNRLVFRDTDGNTSINVSSIPGQATTGSAILYLDSAGTAIFTINSGASASQGWRTNFSNTDGIVMFFSPDSVEFPRLPVMFQKGVNIYGDSLIVEGAIIAGDSFSVASRDFFVNSSETVSEQALYATGGLYMYGANQDINWKMGTVRDSSLMWYINHTLADSTWNFINSPEGDAKYLTVFPATNIDGVREGARFEFRKDIEIIADSVRFVGDDILQPTFLILKDSVVIKKLSADTIDVATFTINGEAIVDDSTYESIYIDSIVNVSTSLSTYLDTILINPLANGVVFDSVTNSANMSYIGTGRLLVTGLAGAYDYWGADSAYMNSFTSGNTSGSSPANYRIYYYYQLPSDFAEMIQVTSFFNSYDNSGACTYKLGIYDGSNTRLMEGVNAAHTTWDEMKYTTDSLSAGVWKPGDTIGFEVTLSVDNGQELSTGDTFMIIRRKYMP